MSGQFLTLGEIKAAAIYRGDLEGISDRHPDFNLTFEVNASMRMLRLKMANNDVRSALTTTALLSLPTVAALAGKAYWAELPWPSDAVSVHGLDVLLNGTWDTIDPGMLEQRRPYGLSTGRGEYPFSSQCGALWTTKSLPQATATAGVIMVFPVPTSGQYILWYLTAWVDITTDTLEFPGQEAWLQWVIWDVACKALIRDEGQTPQSQLVKCEEAREAVWADIKPAIQRVTNDGPIQVQSRYGLRGNGGARMVP